MRETCRAGLAAEPGSSAPAAAAAPSGAAKPLGPDQGSVHRPPHQSRGPEGVPVSLAVREVCSKSISGDSEVLLCERPPGTGFEISLELERLGAIREFDSDRKLPRPVFVCMNGFPGIVLLQAPLKIGCQTHIEASRINIALKDIDVMHERSAFAKATA